jgi:hypothetical protein
MEMHRSKYALTDINASHFPGRGKTRFSLPRCGGCALARAVQAGVFCLNSQRSEMPHWGHLGLRATQT